jgi:hypothetical protein
MTEAAKKKPGPLAAVWNGMSRIIGLVESAVAAQKVQQQRLANIEDRMASIDGGDGSTEAASLAKLQVSARLRTAGLSVGGLK